MDGLFSALDLKLDVDIELFSRSDVAKMMHVN